MELAHYKAIARNREEERDLAETMLTEEQEKDKRRERQDRIKVAKPETYDGDRKKYEGFRRSVTTYLSAGRYSDKEKIIFALSYMTKGFANDWASAAHDRYEDEGYETYREFLQQLDDTFKDQNAAQKARDKLNDFKQLSLSADEFFVKFEALMVKAGINKKDNKVYLIGRLEQNVKWDLIDRISQSENQPQTYDEWKQRIILLDGLQRRREEQKKQWQNRGQYQGRPNAGSDPRPRPSSRPSSGNERRSAPDRSQAQGNSTGGEKPPVYAPMEIDRQKARREGLCYRCGGKGHMGYNCPSNEKQVRATQNEEEDRDAEIAKLKDELECAKKEISAKKDF